MKLLQVCNVGDICGGTAACAWSITHALPNIQHAVAFLSRPTPQTHEAFSHCQQFHTGRIDQSILDRVHADLIILHNTAPKSIDCHPSVAVMMYHHSAGVRAAADMHVACSQWLADRVETTPAVLYQPIPIPARPAIQHVREFDDHLRVGRICTPVDRKWPQELIPFYAKLAKSHQQVLWEFVGAPAKMQDALANACRQRAVFHVPCPAAKSLMWNWHAQLYHHPQLVETFGRTCAESMRAGCVPIVDGRGGFVEQIEHHTTGFLCQNTNAFDDALGVLQCSKNRRQISLDARVAAASRFSCETFYARFRSLLMEHGLMQQAAG